MSRLNEFLSTAAKNKSLSIVHYRADGIVPHTEHMAKKICAVIKSVAPETRCEESAVGPANPGPSQHAMVVEKLLAMAPRTARYLDRGAKADHAGNPLSPAEHMTLLAQLHDASLADFGRMSGDRLPLNVVASASSAMFDTLPADKLKEVDSLFQHSFADAKAVMAVSIADGAEEGKKAVDVITSARTKNGDINAAEGLSNSHDTSGVLTLVNAELSGGADYSRLSPDKLNAHARSIAAQSIGIWLSNQGVPMRTANGFADFIDDVAATSQQAAVTAGHNMSEAAKTNPRRPRMH